MFPIEISTGLDLLWRNNIKPSNVLLGLGFYGRSFAIADLSCNTPGCAFDKHDGTGGRAPGECTSTSDILSDYEISRIIKDFSIKANYDKKGGGELDDLEWESMVFCIPI